MTIRRQEVIRGRLLYYLALLYPQAATLTLLQGEMDLVGYPMMADDLRFHVAYLAEKGLVSVERQRGPLGRREVELVKITARGIDYHDGRLPEDEGIYRERSRAEGRDGKREE